MRRHAATITLATLTAAVLLLAGCGADDDSVAGPSSVADLTDSQGAPACDQLAGMPTDELVANAVCVNPGGTEVLAFASYACPDGRQLMWNDYGWGYSDGAWQAHARIDGQLVPPDDDMAACSA